MSQQFIPLSVPNFSGNEKQYVNEAVISEWVSTGGSKVSEFEEKIAEYTHMPRAVACNSGTSGLHLAMLMAGVGRGDEVLAPALTFIAAVNPIRYAGAEPVFIGCGESLCLCPALAGEWLAANTEQRDGKCVNRHTGAHVKALLAVHVFGNMANMPGLVELCRKYGLVLIEDSTEALGTYYTEGPYRGKMAGTIGDIGVYSFNGNKIITTGAGGMVVSNHADWLERAKHLSTQAKADELQFVHDEVGYNYRLTNLQAALGLAQLEQLEGLLPTKTKCTIFIKSGWTEKTDTAFCLSGTACAPTSGFTACIWRTRGTRGTALSPRSRRRTSKRARCGRSSTSRRTTAATRPTALQWPRISARRSSTCRAPRT